MRKISILIACLLLASTVHGQALFRVQKAVSSANVPAFVQVAPLGSNSGVASISFTFSGSVTNGNTIAMWICWIDPTATFSGFSKTSGTATVGAFTTVGSNGSGLTVTNGSDHCNDGWVQVTGTGTLTITATLSATAAGLVTSSGSEYSLILASTPVDTQAMQSQTSQSGTNAATSGLATTGSSGDLIFGFNVDFGGNASLVAAGTGFNARFTGTSSLQQEDLVQATAGSIAATFTYTGGTADTTISGMIAFKHS